MNSIRTNRSPLILCSLSALLFACAETETPYRDTERLERPPEFAAAPSAQPASKPADPVVTRLSIQQGLGDKVALEKNASRTRLIIKEPFEQAWFIVELILTQQRLEITDRNRDAGYYYVRYDPDDDGSLGWTDWLFRNDDYLERTYALQLSENREGTAISADIVAEADDKTLLEGAPEPRDDIDNDGPNRLLQMLYLKLRDGIPKHQQQ
ncbi:MAG: hypothetical protein Kow0065_19620 [Methylomicrobium sp.]